MSILDYRFRQADWRRRRHIVNDGFCHTMTVEWLVAILQGRSWVVDVEGFRALSRARSYADRHAFPSDAAYNALDVDNEYVEEVVRSSRTLRSRRIWPSRGDVRVYRNCQYLEPGCGLLLRIETPDGNHSLGLLRRVDGTFMFLDVNEGQYHWQPGTLGLSVSFDVRDHLTKQNATGLDACWIGPEANLGGVI